MANIIEENVIIKYIFGDKSKFNSDVDSANKKVKGFNDVVKDAEKALLAESIAKQKSAKEAKNLAEQQENAAKETEALGNELDKTGDAAKENANDVGKARQSVKKSILDFEIFGKSINGVRASLTAKRAALRSTVTALGGATNGLKAFRVALAATGIGLILVALASLVALLKRTTGGADFLAKAFGSVSAVIDVVLGRLTKIGAALTSLFTGDFAGAAENVKGAFVGINEEIQRSLILVNALVDLQRQLKNDALALTFTQAVLNKQIKEANLLGEDTSKSLKEREGAIQRSLDLNQQLLKSRQDFNAEEQRALRIQIALEGDQNKALELRQELADKIAEGFNIETQQLELQTTQNNKLNTIRAEAQRKRLARLEEERKLRERIEANNLKASRQNEDLITELLTSELEKRAAQLTTATERRITEIRELVEAGLLDADIANAQVDLLRQILRKGLIDLSSEFLGEIDQLIRTQSVTLKVGDVEIEANIIPKIQTDTAQLQEAIAPFQEIIDNFGITSEAGQQAQREIDKIRESFLTLTDRPEDQALFEVIPQQAQSAADRTLSIFQKLGRGLVEAFNKDDLEALQGLVTDFLDTQTGVNEERIAQNEKLITQSRERIDLLKEDEELNADAINNEKDRIAELQQSREAALEQDRRNAKTKIAINNALTLSEGLASIISAFKSGDIATGLIQVAQILATLAAARTQLSNLSGSIPAFREGTPYVDGPGTSRSDSILSRLSKGERVTDAANNARLIGAGIIDNNKMVDFALAGHKIANMRINPNRIQTPGPSADVGALKGELKELRNQNKQILQFMENLRMNVSLDSKGFVASQSAVRSRINKNKGRRS